MSHLSAGWSQRRACLEPQPWWFGAPSDFSLASLLTGRKAPGGACVLESVTTGSGRVSLLLWVPAPDPAFVGSQVREALQGSSIISASASGFASNR